MSRIRSSWGLGVSLSERKGGSAVHLAAVCGHRLDGKQEEGV